MKRIFRKNQVIITSLVIMIIVAGYLNFTADKVTTTQDEGSVNTVTQNVDDLGNITAQEDGEDTLINVDVAPEEDLSQVMDSSEAVAENGTEDEIGNVEDIGEAVLTSTTSPAAVNFCSAARLSREQTRSKNKETLQQVIDNENVAAEIREEASNDLVNLTNIAEKELAAETLLEAKGFANSVVSINDESVDVVICLETLTDAQKAQIEDIVTRKTECTTDKIVITTLKSE
ncbi:MAG TPA: SpoIIIAH-like family protein [Candidatus Scybalocola faecavium]|nr:SpoIIIAH-like family protein [Candidatus Scybalocola faecavium]